MIGRRRDCRERRVQRSNFPIEVTREVVSTPKERRPYFLAFDLAHLSEPSVLESRE